MIGILGGMGTQAGLDFCNKLAMLNRGKSDQEYPLFMLYNKSNIPGRPESIGVQTKLLSTIPRNPTPDLIKNSATGQPNPPIPIINTFELNIFF